MIVYIVMVFRRPDLRMIDPYIEGVYLSKDHAIKVMTSMADLIASGRFAKEDWSNVITPEGCEETCRIVRRFSTQQDYTVTICEQQIDCSALTVLAECAE